MVTMRMTYMMKAMTDITSTILKTMVKCIMVLMIATIVSTT